jgi:DNA-binding response OmpR family regulator
VATVLVIEDDVDMRELERTALTCGGHEVLVAANGREGLRALEGRNSPCVILLDLMMPVMDGLTFLVERDRQQVAAGVPVLCVSAAGEKMVSQALRLGAKECLTKPVDIDQLCERVAYYCNSL